MRARALSDLAEIVDCFGELLAQDPGSEQYAVAEAFVLGLAAAAQLQVRHGHPVQEVTKNSSLERSPQQVVGGCRWPCYVGSNGKLALHALVCGV